MILSDSTYSGFTSQVNRTLAANPVLAASSSTYLKSLYETDGIARKICKVIPQAVCGQTYSVQIDDESVSIRDRRGVEDQISRFMTEFAQAWATARLYGWVALTPIYEGEVDLSLRSIPRKARPITGYAVYPGGISGTTSIGEYEANPSRFDYLHPKTLVLPDGQRHPITDFHIISGIKPVSNMSDSIYTGDRLGTSALIPCLPGLYAWATLQTTLGKLLVKQSIDIIEIEDMTSLMLDEGRFAVWLQNLGRAIECNGVIPLDTTSEYYTVDRKYQDLDKVALIIKEYLSGASEIPIPILFDTNPQGSGKSGSFEADAWADQINQQTKQVLLPVFQDLLPSFCTGTQINPETVTLEFSDLTGDTERDLESSKTKADILKVLAEIAATSENAEVLSKVKQMILNL